MKTKIKARLCLYPPKRRALRRELWRAIEDSLEALRNIEGVNMKELDDLTAQVGVTETAEQAAIVYVQGVPALIAAGSANVVDPTVLSALTARLKTSSDNVSAALAAAPQPAATGPTGPTGA
jgi:hypothetical protein